MFIKVAPDVRFAISILYLLSRLRSWDPDLPIHPTSWREVSSASCNFMCLFDSKISISDLTMMDLLKLNAVKTDIQVLGHSSLYIKLLLTKAQSRVAPYPELFGIHDSTCVPILVLLCKFEQFIWNIRLRCRTTTRDAAKKKKIQLAHERDPWVG